jgi:hypothetical protein
MCEVANLIRINYEKKQRSKSLELKYFLNSVSKYVENGFFDASINNIILPLIKNNSNYSLIFKLFHHHIETSKVNFRNHLVDTIDFLILNYRRNNLLRWISEKKAFKTNEWIEFKEKKLNNTKIIWNKSEYLNDFEKKEKEYKQMLKSYNLFRGPKSIICYENLHKNKEKLTNLKKIISTSNIDIGINCEEVNFLPKIQANTHPIAEENFENKAEFLRDFHLIENQIEIKIFDKKIL